MGLDSLGQALQVVGAVLLVMGAMLLLVGRFPPLGWLPGDILVQRGRLTSYFPLATSPWPPFCS